jgi:energy-coupling factor transporter ATP-binding protein EcfA2
MRGRFEGGGNLKWTPTSARESSSNGVCQVKKPTVSISRLTFSGGQTIDFNPQDKIVLVGPNNSGKSQTLREILGLAKEGEKYRPVTVTKLELVKTGSTEDLRAFLASEAIFRNGSFSYKSWTLPENLTSFWSQPYLYGSLSNGFIKNVDADDRLRICEQQPSVTRDEQKTKPQHILYESEVLMTKISTLFKQAFGKELLINFRGGKVIPIHVGDKPPKHLKNQVGDKYVSAVEANPLLDKQGDGMKSYAGILFEAIVSDLDITLIDEPEAFLHPPQMRRLGATLASEVNGQLLIATHSSDVLRGFLEGTKGSLRILRIQRNGKQNFIAEAAPSVIKELWTRPTLRYSNALEGIFHEQTIICEDDSDCRLINAMADHLEAKDGSPWSDTAYIPTGGKHAIPKVAAVLRKIGVPVKAVFDIDFLSEATLLRETVNAFGGDWEKLKPCWARLDSAVRGGKKTKSVEEIKSDIVTIIEESAPDDLPRRQIEETMKNGKPWSFVKEFGSIAIPSGKAQQDFLQLCESLESMGIYVIPVGEIESFCKEIDSHGPAFVSKLLTEVPLEDGRLSELQTFVRRVHFGPYGQ